MPMSLIYLKLGTFAYSVTPVLVIGGAIFWANSSERLTAVEAFPTLAIVVIVGEPLKKIMSSYSNMSSALACVRRIQEFLLLEEMEDRRISWTTADYVEEKSGAVSFVQIEQKFARDGAVISGLQLSIKTHNNTYLIRDGTFDIHRSTITIVTGPVASGKSLLLRALLGEVRFEGTIKFDAMENTIAYCDQKPWLCNLSIRQNIVGDQPFDSAWYENVLETCLLTEDLLRLSEGDESLAGSEGVNLSGGQKQRVVSRQQTQLQGRCP